MPSRTCPACSRRYAGLIDPDCVICAGVGALTLGAAGLHKNDPAVAARAVEIYLEVTARHALKSLPIGEPRMEALSAAVAELKHAGLLADSLTVVELALGSGVVEHGQDPIRMVEAHAV